MPKYDQFDLDVRNLKVNVLYVDEETSINACDSSGSGGPPTPKPWFPGTSVKSAFCGGTTGNNSNYQGLQAVAHC